MEFLFVPRILFPQCKRCICILSKRTRLPHRSHLTGRLLLAARHQHNTPHNLTFRNGTDDKLINARQFLEQLDTTEGPFALRSISLPFRQIPTGQPVEELPMYTILTRYIDTHSGVGVTVTNNTPTVLMCHTLPGSHMDLLPLAEEFYSAGWRVIIINSYGFGLTQAELEVEDRFYSLQVLEDCVLKQIFLESTGVKRVDLALGHGFGVTAALSAASRFVGVRMLALVNPMPVHNVFQLLHKRIVKKFIRTWRLPADTDRDAVFNTLLSVGALDMAEVAANIASLHIRQIPMFIASSAPCGFCTDFEMLDLVSLCGVQHAMLCDEQGAVVSTDTLENIIEDADLENKTELTQASEFDTSPLSQWMVMESAGTFPHNNPDLRRAMVQNMLKLYSQVDEERDNNKRSAGQRTPDDGYREKQV